MVLKEPRLSTLYDKEGIGTNADQEPGDEGGSGARVEVADGKQGKTFLSPDCSR